MARAFPPPSSPFAAPAKSGDRIWSPRLPPAPPQSLPLSPSFYPSFPQHCPGIMKTALSLSLTACMRLQLHACCRKGGGREGGYLDPREARAADSVQLQHNLPIEYRGTPRSVERTSERGLCDNNHNLQRGDQLNFPGAPPSLPRARASSMRPR